RPDASHALFTAPGGNPEGTSTIAGGVPARGDWFAANPIANDRCISIQTGASTRYIVQVTELASCAATCGGAGVLSGQTRNDCLLFSAPGLSAAAQTQELATFLNTKNATTGASAFAKTDCNSLGAGFGGG